MTPSPVATLAGFPTSTPGPLQVATPTARGGAHEPGACMTARASHLPAPAATKSATRHRETVTTPWLLRSIFAGASKDACWLALTGAELVVQAPYTGTSRARATVCARV